MSASLVGSEMCIRDRLSAAQHARSGNTQRPRDRRVHHAIVHRRRAVPVSYTHLTLPTICSV
eukprot:7231834-Alexandrium_andersonii.AAC.1